jgi:peptidoglycan/LPS O-acetylase OafA/YrhL
MPNPAAGNHRVEFADRGLGRLAFVDGLRGIAALAVVLPHAVGFFANHEHPNAATRAMVRLSSFGHLGVDVFFVISGFVVSLTLFSVRITPGVFGRFLLRRSVRLDPPYWVAIALMGAFLRIQARLGKGHLPLPSGWQLLAHLCYLQGILGYTQINVAFWTLCIEFQFYFVWCLALGCFQRGLAADGLQTTRARWSLILFVLALAWPAGVVAPIQSQVFFFSYFAEFLAGAVAWCVAANALSLGSGVAALALFEGVSLAKTNVECATAAATALLILFSVHRGATRRWLSSGFWQFLGKISYSLYLVHVPICLGMLGLRTRMYASDSEWRSWLLFGATVAASILAATLLNRTIELPAIDLSRRLSNRSPVIPAPSPSRF